jgi:adenosine deaminase
MKTDNFDHKCSGRFHNVPKVELHLHLEGAIPPAALWRLIQKYGSADVKSLDEVQERFVFTNFEHFINTWIWKNTFIREYEDFELIAEAVAFQMAEQKIVYAEVFFSAPDFYRFGLRCPEIAMAIRAGLNKVPQIEIKLISDLVRDYGAESAMLTLHEVNEIKSEAGVIGIGIGGSEAAYPADLFWEVYARARTFGFRTTAHAGEAAGADSIWQALNVLEADRIGHGTRAFEDPALLEQIARLSIPVEMCPISNVCTRVVSQLSAHPIRDYFDRGLLISVNTDDPSMFGTSLCYEFESLSEDLNFTDEEIKQLMLNAVESSWASVERKNQLRECYSKSCY